MAEQTVSELIRRALTISHPMVFGDLSHFIRLSLFIKAIPQSVWQRFKCSATEAVRASLAPLDNFRRQCEYFVYKTINLTGSLIASIPLGLWHTFTLALGKTFSGLSISLEWLLSQSMRTTAWAWRTSGLAFLFSKLLSTLKWVAIIFIAFHLLRRAETETRRLQTQRRARLADAEHRRRQDQYQEQYSQHQEQARQKAQAAKDAADREREDARQGEEGRRQARDQETRRYAELYRAWKTACELRLRDKRTMRAVPQLAQLSCRDVSCVQRMEDRGVGFCFHTLEMLVKAAGRFNERNLHAEVLTWAPDRFSQCPGEVREGVQRVAEELFKMYRKMEEECQA